MERIWGKGGSLPDAFHILNSGNHGYEHFLDFNRKCRQEYKPVKKTNLVAFGNLDDKLPVLWHISQEFWKVVSMQALKQITLNAQNKSTQSRVY